MLNSFFSIPVVSPLLISNSHVIKISNYSIYFVFVPAVSPLVLFDQFFKLRSSLLIIHVLPSLLLSVTAPNFTSFFFHSFSCFLSLQSKIYFDKHVFDKNAWSVTDKKHVQWLKLKMFVCLVGHLQNFSRLIFNDENARISWWKYRSFHLPRINTRVLK